MISPMPTMMRKPKNGISTGGRSSTGKVSSPISRAVQLPEAMKLPSLGISIAKRLRWLACVGPGDQHLRGRLLALPAGLDRGELRRLVLEHVEAGEVAEEQLHRDQHRRQPEAPVQHDPRLRTVNPAQHVPGAGGRDAHRGGQERGQQHVRPAHHHHRPEHDLAPVRRDDLAVDDLVADRHLHPGIVGEDPERGEHRSERHHAAGEEVEAAARPGRGRAA